MMRVSVLLLALGLPSKPVGNCGQLRSRVEALRTAVLRSKVFAQGLNESGQPEP